MRFDTDFDAEAAQLADALIREPLPVGKPEMRRAPAGAAPTAGAMQLLSTAVSHWPVLFSWSQLAALNGRKARGGHFNTCRKLLIDGGLVAERDGGKVEPAEAAFDRLGIARKKRPGTRGEVLDMWLAALPSPAKDILREVAGQADVMTAEDVGRRLSLAPRGGHWNTGVSMLRSNDLIRTSPAGFEIGEALLGLKNGPLLISWPRTPSATSPEPETDRVTGRRSVSTHCRQLDVGRSCAGAHPSSWEGSDE